MHVEQHASQLMTCNQPFARRLPSAPQFSLSIPQNVPPRTTAAARSRPAQRRVLRCAESEGGTAEDPVHRKVAEFGNALARSQQEAFLAAQDQLRQHQQNADQSSKTTQQQAGAHAILAAAAAVNEAAAFVGGAGVKTTTENAAAATADGTQAGAAQPADGEEAPEAGGGGSTFADAVREKLARVAAYRQQKREAEAQAAEEGSNDDKSGKGGQPGVVGGARGRGQAGGTDVAAGFLQNVLDNPMAGSVISKDVSAEKFSRLREAERRKNVEIITVERDYLSDIKEEPTLDAEGQLIYKPKVATWGMFPRPDNISRAYGGGRTLKPGEALESDDARAARMKRVSQALASYRKDSGFEVDPKVEAEAQSILDTGMQQFRNGQLTAALIHFSDAAARMPLRTKVGGLARMQQAITLDSLGKSEEAKAMYASLRGHPSAQISKQVGRLLNGFKAADFLKAESFSYRIEKGAYDKYFNSVESFYNFTYYSVNDESQEDLRAPTFVAAAVVLAPLALLGAKIASTALAK